MKIPIFRKWLKYAIRPILFTVIIICGFLVYRYFMATSPTIERSRPKAQPPLVEVTPVTVNTIPVTINAMGTVVPAQELSLYSQVSGTVEWISSKFKPGDRLVKGEVLLKLETIDYQLAVRRQKSVIKQLQADIDLESGQQQAAQSEMKVMERTLGYSIKNRDLALRIPQMKKLKANLEAEQITLEQAKLDLKRTIITTPFNALVLERSVEIGGQITTQSTLATLVGTDSFWIEASVPVTQLKWIDIPEFDGDVSSDVRVLLADGNVIWGKVIKLLGNISDSSQMARILVEVKDPLDLNKQGKKSPLLLKSYVTMEVVGIEIKNVIQLPRTYVKDGNTVWIFSDNKLKIQNFTPIWEDENYIYVRHELAAGDLIISSDLPTAVEGMEIRLNSSEINRKNSDQLKMSK